jgi:hypothetical protein
MFGSDICLCGSEQDPNTYNLGVDTIAVSCSDGFPDLRDAFGGLFKICPAIEDWQHCKMDPEIDLWHRRLREAFLRHLKKSCSQDLPIAYSEANLAIAILGAFLALVGVAIAVPLHWLSAHYP